MLLSKVTLIYPRLKYPSGDFQLGLASIGASLKQKVRDAEVDLIDTTYHPSLHYVSERLKSRKPDLVGIYMCTIMYDDAIKAAEIAKAHSATVVTGGPHPTILPETVIGNQNVDIVCIGEGEETFGAVVQAHLEGKKYDHVEGIWYKENGRIMKNPQRKPIEDLDLLPFPDVDLFDVETYIKNFIQFDSFNSDIRGLSMIVSRGCPFQCSYCQPTLSEIFGKKFRIRSPQNVVDQLTILKKKYRLEAVYFQDDTLTVSREWMHEFCQRMVQENVGILWACNTRVDTVDEGLLKQMKQAGLVKLKIGIESFSDRIRNGIYRKGITLSQINSMIEMATDLGVQLAGFFMLGAPSETVKEIMGTIKLSAKSKLKEANFSIAVPLPKTGLYEMARERGWRLPEKFGDYDYYHASRPPITEGDLPSRRLELFKKLAYLVFYLYPTRIRKTLKQLLGLRGMGKTIQKLKRF